MMKFFPIFVFTIVLLFAFPSRMAFLEKSICYGAIVVNTVLVGYELYNYCKKIRNNDHRAQMVLLRVRKPLSDYSKFFDYLKEEMQVSENLLSKVFVLPSNDDELDLYGLSITENNSMYAPYSRNGTVYISEEIIQCLLSDDACEGLKQIAYLGVLAHEFSHIYKRHRALKITTSFCVQSICYALPMIASYKGAMFFSSFVPIWSSAFAHIIASISGYCILQNLKKLVICVDKKIKHYTENDADFVGFFSQKQRQKLLIGLKYFLKLWDVDQVHSNVGTATHPSIMSRLQKIDNNIKEII